MIIASPYYTFVILDRRHAGIFLKHLSESFVVSVPYFVHHLVDRFSATLKSLLGHFDLYALCILNGRIPRGFDKTPVKIPAAYSKHRAQFVYRNFFMKRGLEVGLRFFYNVIA